MLERDVKAEVKKLLVRHGAWYAMTVPTGYGKRGIPDFLVCHRGRFVGVEAKVSGRHPTPHQELELAGIRAAGGQTLVIDETNLRVLEEWLK